MPTTDHPDVGPTTRRRLLTTLGIVGVAAVAGSASCTRSKPPAWHGAGGTSPGGAGKAKVSITEPAAGAKDVPAATEIVFTATDAVSTQVVLKDAAGAEVAGALHPDGAGWLPTAALAFGATYTATVTATDDDGKAATCPLRTLDGCSTRHSSDRRSPSRAPHASSSTATAGPTGTSRGRST